MWIWVYRLNSMWWGTLRLRRNRIIKNLRRRMRLLRLLSKRRWLRLRIWLNFSKRNLGLCSERYFGSRNSYGSLRARTIWWLAGATRSRMRPSSRSIWTRMICSCTASCTEQQLSSWRIRLANWCRRCRWWRLQRLRCATRHAGRTKCLRRSIGFMRTKCLRHRLQACSLAQDHSLLGASVIS